MKKTAILIFLFSVCSWAQDFSQYLGEYERVSGNCPEEISVETFGYGRYLNVVDLSSPSRMRPYLRFENVNGGADFAYSGDNSQKVCFKTEMDRDSITYYETDWINVLRPCSFSRYSKISSIGLTSEGMRLLKQGVLCEYRLWD